jgi:hypothetical protein
MQPILRFIYLTLRVTYLLSNNISLRNVKTEILYTIYYSWFVLF